MPGGCYDLFMFSNSNNNYLMFLYNDGVNYTKSHRPDSLQDDPRL